MSGECPVNHSSATENTSNMPFKKRKLRKGTQSCWECKRRKIRCTFAAPTDATCDGCKSRQTRCISQEFPDEAATRKGANRLNRIESLVEELIQRDSSDTLRPKPDEITVRNPTTVLGRLFT